MHLNREHKLLFIGDSITDCHRAGDPEGLGDGYVRSIRDYLAAKSPADCPTILNRGTSGHKVTDLAARWQRDVLANSPDLVSIMIGINDVWHGLMPGGRGVPIEQYVSVYRDLIRQIREQLPACEIVLCQPTVIRPPAPAQGNVLLKPYVNTVIQLAEEFRVTALVHLHETFEHAERLRPDIAWCPDGVHPSPTGHMLIARAWLLATNLL